MSRPTFVECLEERRLLAVDLSVSVVTPTLPPSVLIGAVGRGRVALAVSNLDTAALARNTPRIDVQVFAVSQGTPNGVLVGQARNVSVAGLRDRSRPKRVTVPVTLPRSLPAGEYTLRVVADPLNRVSEGSGTLSNNGATLASTVVVSSPFSRLTVTGLTYKVKNPTAGAVGTAVASIRNLGNVTVRGTASIRILSSPTDSGVSAVPAELGRVDNVRITVGANKTIRYSRNLRFITPVNVNLGSAQYVIFAEIIPGTLNVTDTGSQRDRRASSTQPVTIPASPRTSASPLIFGVASSLTFTATQSFGDPTVGLAESGTIVDSNGRTGRYTYAFVPATANLPQSTAYSLDFPIGPQGQPPFTADYVLDFTSTPLSTFSGRTVVFGASSNIAGTLKVKQTSDPGVAFSLS